MIGPRADPPQPPVAGPPAVMPPATGKPLFAGFHAVLLDLDGTVYVGTEPVPGVADTVAALRGNGLACCFLTNNAARTAATIAEQLRGLGVPARDEDVVTSAQAAARLLAGELTPGAAVLVVGGQGLEAALIAAGLRPVRSAEDGPAAVVQGFAPEVGWRQLAEGAYAISRGLPWVATNRDLTLPTARGLAPGNGSLVHVLHQVTGAEPRVAGKPERALVDAALDRVGGGAALVVGDRLDTDIACAARAGLPSLLVLTGVTDARLLLSATAGMRPTYMSPDVSGILRRHPSVVRDEDGGWNCRGWRATVDGGVLSLRPASQREGDGRYDGLRAACAASWAEIDRSRRAVDVTEAVATLGL